MQYDAGWAALLGGADGDALDMEIALSGFEQITLSGHGDYAEIDVAPDSGAQVKIEAGAGEDDIYVFANSATDRIALFGGDDADALEVDGGIADVYGGAGNDTHIHVSAYGDTQSYALGGDGDDMISGIGNVVLIGGAGSDTVQAYSYQGGGDAVLMGSGGEGRSQTFSEDNVWRMAE